jgi:hypothetical protein
MIHKLLRFIENPFYRKVDSIKDWFYLFRSNYFRVRHDLDFTEVNDFGYDEMAYESKKNGNAYANGSYYYCKLMLDWIDIIDYEYQFIDIGSGKGKICFEVARDWHFSEVVGVEYESRLVEAANKNKKLLDSNVAFVWSDASKYLLPDGKNIVYIFNSFNDVILKKFIDNNKESLRKNKSIILYAQNIHRTVFLNNGARALYEDLNRRQSIFIFD